ncbi:unnamed protein product [Acanthocheilonema viteae]|uniref:Fibrinogen C-terminal domain-containing protein n=1 Tax=Acanthocheilonema viteae TaxID=6277 RepID=A0A498SAZ5_ACAVI|nr:unnamed protein product [Acanthocheilonema viteae]
MREYNNQDAKIDETELDPCIAAEIRMKKMLFSQRTRRNLLILFVFIAMLIVLSVLLFFLLPGTSSKETDPKRNVSLPEVNLEISHSAFESSPIATSKFSKMAVNDSLIVTIETTSSKSSEIGDDAFSVGDNDSLENPMSTATSILDLLSTATAVTTVITSVTTTVATSLYTTNTSRILEQSTGNIVTLPLIKTDKQIEGSITLPLFIDTDDNIDSEIEDCKALLNNDKNESGIYQIFLPKIGKFNVLCDMKTNDGGWTVIQKRKDGQIHFANRTWNEYKNGFGELTSSFWLGLDKIYELTAKDDGNPVTLRIELRGDLCEDKNGCSKQPNGYWWGEWDFNIGNASKKYTLSISSALAGNLSERTTTDRFHYMNNGKSFTTIDQDNDKFQGNCAQFRDFGGWWHNDCGYVALNGRYGDRTSKMRNMFWFYGSGTRPFINYYIKPRETEMKIRSKS